MIPPKVTANPAEYYAWPQWAMTTPDPAARDETPKPDNERSARTCCGDSPRSIDRRAVSRAATPDPTRDTGNNATAPEQTIDGATPLNRDPFRTRSGVFVSADSRPAPGVEANAGRAAS